MARPETGTDAEHPDMQRSQTERPDMEHDETDPLRAIVAGGRLGVLATTRRDGRPQLSNVAYAYDDVHDQGDGPGGGSLGVVRISVTASRAKTRNLRRDPRASLHVQTDDGWAYAVAEGAARLTPVAASPDDATVDELVALYRRLQGEHPDWAEFRAAMVEDRRLLVRLSVERFYGWSGPGTD